MSEVKPVETVFCLRGELWDRALIAEARVAELKLLLDMLCGTIETHEIESLSCDRDGNYYCECLREQTARTRAAIDQQLAQWEGSA